MSQPYKPIAVLVLMMVAGSGLEAQDTGLINGTVTVTGYKNAANAVVYIEPEKPETASTEEPALVDQENFTFIPHVLAVQVGTTVDFLNSDAELHNVFTPDKIAGKFNLGSWPKGQKRSYTFKKPGSVVLLCNVHPEMEGWVFVSPSPYYIKTGPDGSFLMEDIPAGKYTLNIWHEELDGKPQTVIVNPGDTTSADFSLTH